MSFNQPISISGKCYFCSDFHLGVPNEQESKLREKRIESWFATFDENVKNLFLLGDIFDFWFEYNKKPPAKYAAFLQQLVQLQQKGIQIYFFTGNHDMWVRNYLPNQFRIPVFTKPQLFTINGKTFLVGHGDGLGKGDIGYKLLKKFLTWKANRFLFGLLPEKTGFALATFFSKTSRSYAPNSENKYNGDQNEKLTQFCFEYQKSNTVDYFVFGHRHLPLEIPLGNAVYYNTGDWINHDSWLGFEKVPYLSTKDNSTTS